MGRISTFVAPTSSARAFAASSIASALSVMIAFPPGATSSAASSPVSAGPAASSSTVCPGCSLAASSSHCETGIASRWKDSRSRAHPAAASSQRSRLSARYASASMA